MKRKPQKFTHAVANLDGKEYVMPMDPSDEAVRRALLRIVTTAEDAKGSIHERMALADDIIRIVAEELSADGG